MPWHERWFYEDWLLDEVAEAAAEDGEGFNPNQPWVGGRLSPQVAAGLGANVREI